MAKENIQIQIDAAVKSAEAAKSLGELKRSLLDIQSLQAELGETSGANFDKLSTAASSASQRLAETRDAIGDIADRTRTLEGTPVERLTGSFGLLKESIMNLDFEKAKIGADGLLNAFTPVVDGKLVTGFAGIKGALSGLAEGVKTLGTTFLQVGKALLTNPIFLLATAITLIVIAIVKLLDSLGLLKPMLDAIKAAIGFVVDAFKALTDWLGLTTYAQEKNAESAKKNGEIQRAEIDATAAKQQAHLKNIQGMTDDEIAEYKRKAGIKDSLNQNSFDIEKTRLKQTQETLKAEIDALNELKAAGGELTDEQKKDLEQRKKDYQANADAIKQIEADKQKAIIDLNRKADETLQSWKIKNIKDENERAKAQLKVTEAEEIRKIDVAISEAKRLNQNTSVLEQSKLEIKKFFANQELVINETINKKAADAYQNRLQKDLANKEKALQIEVEKTEKGTKERLDAEFKMEDELFEFKKKNKILTGKALELEDIRIQNSQKERLDAFNKGELEAYNANRVLISENRVKQLELNNATEDELYEARRALILTRYDVELKDTEKTEEEKNKVKLDAYLEIKALDEDFAAYKKGITDKELEDAFIKSAADVMTAENEVEQYRRKYERIAFIDEEEATRLETLRLSEVQMLKDAMALELSDTELTEAQKNEIKERYRILNEQQELAAQERLRQAKLKAANDDIEMARKGLTAVQGLTDAFFAVKKRNLEKGSKEEEKAAENQFKVNKALQLGMAIIDGFKSVTSSLSQSPIAIGPVPNPAGIASLAFAIATSAANIVKIAATKFEKSPSPTTPSAGSPGTGGGGTEPGIPPMLQPNQFFGLGQTQPVTGEAARPQKVYVVESDITGTQERVRVIESRAVLG